MNISNTKSQPDSSTLPANYLCIQQYNKCQVRNSSLGNLACPDYALPKIAYQAFLELRMILHAPDEVIMAAILAAMSTACQRWVRVKPPHMDKAHVTTLAIYTGADTGSGKSPVMDKVFAPMRFISLSRIAKCKQNKKKRNDDRLLFRAKQRSLMRKVTKLYDLGMKADPALLAKAEQDVRNLMDIDSTDFEPINMVKGDISPSRLLDDLNGTRVSILMATDEGRKFFGKMTDEDFEMHNQAVDGATVTYERKHHTVIANEPLVTYCAMTHLDVLERFIKNKGDEARASGWFGRGLLSRATPYGRYYTSPVLHPTFPNTDIFNTRSLALLEGSEDIATDDSFEPIILEFDEEATAEFMEMLRANNQRMTTNAEWDMVRDFGRKHPSNVARIAAIFHYFSEQRGTRISKATLLQAINVADWYVGEAKRILAIEPTQRKLEKLVSFLHDKCYIHNKHVNYTDPGEERLIPLRWIMQFHNIEREQLGPLLDMLVQQDAIAYRCTYRGKRCIELNPMLFETL